MRKKAASSADEHGVLLVRRQEGVGDRRGALGDLDALVDAVETLM
jgi:hypothetical protein